jgi:hypothetical protein
MANKDQVEIDIILNEKSLDVGLSKSRAKLESFRQQIIIDQQQIAAAAASQSTDIFRNLAGQVSRFSAQQKAQLSFQVNDIITGLASGQSPFQILAQQGGQIVQIFQMTKVAQEGTAVATAAAAASEATFATSAKAAAVSQAQVAVSSEATAASMTQASGAATVLGASVVSLGAILAAGLVTIGAVYKLTKDIEESAQKRLQREKEITGEFNRQNLAFAELAKRIKDAANARSFGAFAGGDDVVGLRIGLASRQQQRQQLEADFRQQQDRYNRLLQLPGLPADVLKQAFPKEAEDRLRKLDDEIVSITDRLAVLKEQQREDYRNNVFGGVQRAIEADRKSVEQAAINAAKAEQDLAEKRKKMVEESIEKAKEWARYMEQARRTIAETFASTSDNPFVRIFNDGANAIDRVTAATGRLSAGLQQTLRDLINNRTAAADFAQQLDNRLRASDLRDQARQFRAGRRDEDDPSATLRRRLQALGAGASPFTSQDFQYDPRTQQVGQAIAETARNAAERRLIDQQIIRLTEGLDPSKLTGQQNTLAAAAREREALRLENERQQGVKYFEAMNKIIGENGLKVSIANGKHVVEIRNKAKDRAEVTESPSQQQTNSFYDPK